MGLYSVLSTILCPVVFISIRVVIFTDYRSVKGLSQIVCLRAELHTIADNSTLFRDSLGDGKYTGEPIKIPYSSKIIKIYLDLAHLHNRPPSMVWAIREPLLHLCEHLGSKGVSERALYLLHGAVEKDPWQVFALASHKNNLGLARSALRTLDTLKEEGNVVVPSIEGIGPHLASQVTLPYLLGIYVAALKAKDKVKVNGNGIGNIHGSFGGSQASENGHEETTEITWKAIADKFVPVLG